MEWLVFSIVMLFSFYSTNRSSLAPDDLFFAGLDGEPIVCQEISELEANQKGYVKKGKLADFSVSSESVCKKNIFVFGERDGKVDLITNAARSRSTQVSLIIGRILKVEKDLDIPILIDTSNIDHYKVAAYLQTVFTDTMINSHHGGVIRKAPIKSSYRILKIEIMPTVFPEDIIGAKLSKPVKRMESLKWMVL